ncbi:hypothetical protein O1D97_09760 [Marinomonas sp. 15G1-11]|uniref:Uncharacterized protein n=1 Tax=Marinomonas phaeophyticola TaxID=3004091 RepID=A0ABT4JU55_9GAMM|nr:hypothetical protein [Marinomonas sp. 15G1-11]MCZ2721928.1 hypothetical protein [Marinomonas sp. 15G1-11]
MKKSALNLLTKRDISAHEALGEYCLISAPKVSLPNGESCVPQHFYGYDHTLESVESILNKISFSKHYPIFCEDDGQGVIIQIGIIGRENYQKNCPNRASKIVYGRKWRVEPNLSTSEIIQTVFLAIQKAREHEIRELLTLRSSDSNKVSTPFNSHHDLPLMAQCYDLFEAQTIETETFSIASIQAVFDLLRFDQTTIKCLDVTHRHNGQTLVDFMFTCAEEHQSPDFAELHGIECTLILKQETTNELLYKLMDALIELSNHYVEEHFSFNGFARFSRKNCIQAVGEFSINTRLIDDTQLNAQGKKLISEHNCSVDETRAPVIRLEQQKQRLSQNFEGIQLLEGFLPKGVNIR